MSNLNDNNSQNTKMYSNGILTSLLLPKKRSSGCFWFLVVFLGFTVGATVALSIIFFLNATKIFSNIGRYALRPTMQAINSDVLPIERTEFSNAYIKIFDHIDEKGITDIDPWTITAMTNLATSAKDHKISREESIAFVKLVENESNTVTNKQENNK